MSAIEEIKQKLDIVEVIGEYTSLTKAGRTFKGLCPLHSEKTPSFYVYPEQQSWHCFGACSTGGDVFSFLMKKQNLSFGEVLQLLARKTGVSLPSRGRPQAEKKEQERLYEVNEAAAGYFHDLLLNSEAAGKARDYLSGRGLEAGVVSSFKLGYSLNSWEALKKHLLERGYKADELLEAGVLIKKENGEVHDRFRNKVMFPICNTAGRTIGFGARVLDQSLPKYVNSPQTPLFDKSGSIYGIELAQEAIRERGLAVIVEGYMDALTAHQNGFKNVVASMGTSITERQVSILKRLSKNIALALDADLAGEEAMLRCVGFEDTLGAEITVARMPEGKDPDEVIRENPATWQVLLEKAIPAVDYTFDMATAKLNLEKARDKSEAADRLLPIIAEINNTVRQTHYLQKLGRLLGLNQSEIEQAFFKVKSAKRRPKVSKPAFKTNLPTARPLFSHTIEEYCLALLLKYPELKGKTEELKLKYFEGSENREIFLAWKEAGELSSVKDRLEVSLWEQVDLLVAKNFPPNELESRWEDCLLRLREEYLKNLKRKEVLALQAAGAGTGAELEQVAEIGGELREIFVQKKRRK